MILWCMVVIIWQLDLQLSICNQCILPLTLWVRIPLIQHYVIKFVSDLRQIGGFLRVLRFPPSVKNWTTQHNWNIIESGVKPYNPNPPLIDAHRSILIFKGYDFQRMCSYLTIKQDTWWSLWTSMYTIPSIWTI